MFPQRTYTNTNKSNVTGDHKMKNQLKDNIELMFMFFALILWGSYCITIPNRIEAKIWTGDDFVICFCDAHAPIYYGGK